jgi:hypothetical protein
MIKTRIRPDGVPELMDSDDGVAVQIPHDHEIAPQLGICYRVQR